MNMSVGFRATLWLVIGFLLPTAGWASCGLSYCTSEGTSGWTASQVVKTAQFQRGNFTGSYVAWTPQMRWQAPEGWLLGAFTTVLSMTSTAQSANGLGNIVLFGEIPAWFSEQIRLGAQVELPSAQSNTGLASAHPEWMPYLQWKKDTEFGYWFAKTGARLSLGQTGSSGSGIFTMSETLRPAHAEEHMHGVQVFPHTDRELLGEAGLAVKYGRWTVSPYLGGYYSMVSAAEQSLSAGTRLDWALNAQWRLAATAEFPVTTQRRENSSFGLLVTSTF